MQKNKFDRHLRWYNQAGKDMKNFFFVAEDTAVKEQYPQYFDEEVELKIELSRVATAEPHTNVVATYNLDEDFDVQYERQFPNCNDMQVSKSQQELRDFHEDLAGLNRKTTVV